MNEDAFQKISQLDNQLSNRFIALDPSGYFLIKIDWHKQEIIAELYGNDIDDDGRAIDEETGELLPCNNNQKRNPKKVYRGRSAKEIGIKLTEGDKPYPLSKLDHALYLGREFQRAERCLIEKIDFIQD